ncbi:MAG: GNAT family N-acetyltransferase [Planctomycetota bacterium]|jgi:N-acetylglutamate synthase-like GNAT family acetyltransferase
MKHEVREMKEKDLPKVAALLGESYAYLASTEGFSESQLEALVQERGSEEALRSQMDEYRFMVLDKESVLSGVLAMKGNEITKLFVRSDEMRSGIGTMLFEIAQRAAARAGYDALVVGTTGHAIPFYKAMGMEVEETRIAATGPLAGWEIAVLKKPLHMVNTTRKLHRTDDVHL